MSRPVNATSYLILAMREKWMNLILDGKKTAEVRRTRPARPCDMPDYLYLYHRGHVHGIAEVASYSIPVAETHWVCKWARETVAGYAAMACLDKDKMYEYLTAGVRRGHWRALHPVVYKLGWVQRFQKPIPVPCRPQSWMYATTELRDIIEGKPQTCLNCRYWSMWDHSCATRAVALDDPSPVNPDTPACKEFQPE